MILCLSAVVGLLAGCHETGNNASRQYESSARDFKALSPARALSYGRESAVYQHLSQYWQLELINDTPARYEMYFDLTDLPNGRATLQAPPPCLPIEVEFDISNIETNQLSVVRIERELDDCSDSNEDNLMAILADTKTIQRDGQHSDRIILSSYQDTLTFVLAAHQKPKG